MSSSKDRSVVFVGSSSEGLKVAQALQLNLDQVAEVILWSQGVFGLSKVSLESLDDAVRRSDFAVLVLTPDDLELSQGKEVLSPRDNVVFELGLFMGALGRERCFIVYDRTAELKLPTDLAGVTAATFQPPSAGNLQSALGAPSAQISMVVSKLGPVPRAKDEVQIHQRTYFAIIAELLEPAIHQFLITMHESGVALHREGPYMLGPRYEYVISKAGVEQSGDGSFGVNALCARLADAKLLEPDLRGRIDLTDRGHAFAKWLIESGYRAQYFWSDIGSWGERPANRQPHAHPSTRPRTVFEQVPGTRQEPPHGPPPTG